MAEDCIVPGYLTSRCQVLKRQGQISFNHQAWDHSIYGPKVVVDQDGTYRMFYTAYQENYAPNWRICVATSTDLVTWTKPNLGLHSYGGNTNNNIVLQAEGTNLQFLDMTIDPFWGLYVMTVRNDTTGSNLIYTSDNGVTFTFVSVPFTGTSGALNGGAGTHPDNHVEGKALTWNPVDQKFRFWYNQGQFQPVMGEGRRSIGYYDCATLGGTWVNRGLLPIFTSTSAIIQYYDFSPFYYKGHLWAVVNMFNSTSDVLAPLRLYRSDDHGNTWHRSTDLLRRSAGGSWDNGLITDGCPILIDGVWYFIYGGKTGLHTGVPNQTQITFGMATAVQNPAVADIRKINGTKIIGDGTTTPWGPE